MVSEQEIELSKLVQAAVATAMSTLVTPRFEELNDKIDGVKGEVVSTKKLLTGNGEPEKGYLFRLVSLETWRKAKEKDSDSNTETARRFLAPVFGYLAGGIVVQLAWIIAGHALGMLH